MSEGLAVQLLAKSCLATGSHLGVIEGDPERQEGGCEEGDSDPHPSLPIAVGPWPSHFPSLGLGFLICVPRALLAVRIES